MISDTTPYPNGNLHKIASDNMEIGYNAHGRFVSIYAGYDSEDLCTRNEIVQLRDLLSYVLEKYFPEEEKAQNEP